MVDLSKIAESQNKYHSNQKEPFHLVVLGYYITLNPYKHPVKEMYEIDRRGFLALVWRILK